ncbi:expressed unknown protein [Seminavis robusta]|uniref:Uncharacterized protein n=1 Tax=Seminavis robusta TaxID=568900 RepID=A0A9N8HQM1_9STRA|nr:expressed unknown protein [Seminavis robusta]|eukprot:Sro1179_g249610.1 n/a (365) ;mRNA; r:18378-19472
MQTPPVHSSVAPSNVELPDAVLGKMEPGFLVSKDGSRINFNTQGFPKSSGKSKVTQTRKAAASRKSTRGLRRLCALPRAGSRRRVGIENPDASVKDKENNQPAVLTKNTLNSPKRPSGTVSERLSLSRELDTVSLKSSHEARTSYSAGYDASSCSTQTTATTTTNKSASGNQPLSRVGLLLLSCVGAHSAKNLVKNEKAGLIQAVFRGYLGRCKALELKLRRRLEEIEQSRSAELLKISEYKQNAISSYYEKLFVKPVRSQEERWQKASEELASLLPKVRSARERNTRLQEGLAQSKEDNKQLVLANSSALRSAFSEELRINKIERCGLRLREVANLYKEILQDGRQRLREFEEESGPARAELG